MSETLFRLVEGKRLPVPETEAETIRAEWAANRSKPAPTVEPMPDVRALAREVAALRLEVDALVKVAVKR